VVGCGGEVSSRAAHCNFHQAAAGAVITQTHVLEGQAMQYLLPVVRAAKKPGPQALQVAVFGSAYLL